MGKTVKGAEMNTALFKVGKKLGALVNKGECRFIVGKREYKRTLWFGGVNGEHFVFFHGQWHKYRPYSDKCQIYDYTIGRI